MPVDFDLWGKQGLDFFIGRSAIMDYLYLSKSIGFKVDLNNVFMKNMFFTYTARWFHYLWITVMFYELFELSFWRHPFSAEDPLVSKWCNAKFLQICSDEEKIYIYKLRRFSTNLNFCVNYSFKPTATTKTPLFCSSVNNWGAYTVN